MQYRKDRYGRELSTLGFGCMRFSRKGGGIDIEAAGRQIMAAYHAGVNYFDTAYIYPGSEAALGQILERNGIRNKVAVATKLPQYLIQRSTAVERYFGEQLRRLRTDYVDYYLMHQLTDFAQWEKLKAIGILDWIAEKNAAAPSATSAFPIMVQATSSSKFSAITTGISARSSTTTGTSIPRPASQD